MELISASLNLLFKTHQTTQTKNLHNCFSAIKNVKHQQKKH